MGPVEGTVRSISSTVQPAKGTRNKFTDEDDRILWEWVRENRQKGGGTDGNEIYKQLEIKVRLCIQTLPWCTLLSIHIAPTTPLAVMAGSFYQTFEGQARSIPAPS